MRPREERDRHALHVLEDLPAKVEDEVLAQAGRLQALEEADAGLDDGNGRDEDGEPTTSRRRPSTIASTACPARSGVATPSTAAIVARMRKATIVPPVGAGERRDPPERPRFDRRSSLVFLHGALERRPHVEVAHECHARTSS